MFLRGPCEILSFLLKNYVLVFLCEIVLNTRIVDLLVVNSFTQWFLPLFRFEFKFKLQSFRVYKDQWDILIILPKKSVLLGFHC